MIIREASGSSNQAWDSFVDNSTEGTFYHLYDWKNVLENALGHKTYYLEAVQGEQVVGILPLVHVKSFLFGNTLSSLAFGSYGGAIAVNAEVVDQLEETARKLGNRLGVGCLEFRYLNSSNKDRPRKDLYERFVKTILPTEEQNMEAIRSKQRNIIRKGIKNGLALREDDSDTFYSVYRESVRNLGTPVFPGRLFSELANAFPNSTEFLTAHLDGEPVSSAMVYFYKNEVCPFFWGGRYIARNLAGNDFLAWKILCRAADRGLTQFDFGRSKKDTGSRQWKINLGFEAEQLNYEYILIRDSEMPQLNPSNPKYRLFIEQWKKLPLPVADFIGPKISRYLG